jgi:hypothetical protein
MAKPSAEVTGFRRGCARGAVLGLFLGSLLTALIVGANFRGYGENPAAGPGFGRSFPAVVGAIGGGFFGLLIGAISGGILGAWMAPKSADGRKATDTPGPRPGQLDSSPAKDVIPLCTRSDSSSAGSGWPAEPAPCSGPRWTHPGPIPLTISLPPTPPAAPSALQPTEPGRLPIAPSGRRGWPRGPSAGGSSGRCKPGCKRMEAPSQVLCPAHLRQTPPCSTRWGSQVQVGMFQSRVTLAPAQFVAGSPWQQRGSAGIGRPGTSEKCYPKPAHSEPCLQVL